MDTLLIIGGNGYVGKELRYHFEFISSMSQYQVLVMDVTDISGRVWIIDTGYLTTFRYASTYKYNLQILIELCSFIFNSIFYLFLNISEALTRYQYWQPYLIFPLWCLGKYHIHFHDFMVNISKKPFFVWTTLWESWVNPMLPQLTSPCQFQFAHPHHD